MEKIDLYKILTIENEDGNGDTDFTVANMLDYNETTYLYLMEVDKDENVVETNQKIVRLIINENESAIETITDDKELQEVSRLFYESFEKKMDEIVDEN